MICAFDIGGSKIAAATPISGDPARLKPLGEVPTPTQDFDGFCAALAALLPAGTHRAGVSIAGVIGPEGDVVPDLAERLPGQQPLHPRPRAGA